MPDISIVMPVYNGERYLVQAIESVVAQTVTDWALIVVDDGSVDGTAMLAERFAARDERIRVVRQPNLGVAMARNRGFGETDGASRYIMFLDQDDILAKDALHTLRTALESTPHAIGAHGVIECIDDQGQSCDLGPFMLGVAGQGDHGRRGIVGTRPVAWPAGSPTTFAVLVLHCVITTPGQLLIRRHALEAAGPFDAAMWPSDDWDIYLRLAQGGDFAFVDKATLKYRRHAGNVSRQNRLMRQAPLRVYRKLLANRDLSFEQRRLTLSGYRWYRRDTRRFLLRWAVETIARGHWTIIFAQLRRRLMEDVTA